MSAVDIVTVAHNEENHALALQLFEAIERYEPGRAHCILVDNRTDNRGFAAGCNLGAARGTAAVIGFLNPDCTVRGSFIDRVLAMMDVGADVTGERYGKAQGELDTWGCHDWVCGATFFVTRAWWTRLGGFDERYVWGWEETDFIRRTQSAGGTVRSTSLPIVHTSPDENTPADVAYKHYHFERGAQFFYETWGWR